MPLPALIEGIAYLPHISPEQEIALQTTAEDIVSNYLNGNKSDARTLFKEVPSGKVAYVTLWLVELFDRHGEGRACATFIYSVTE